jgi:AcrR family transcriptional regulator
VTATLAPPRKLEGVETPAQDGVQARAVSATLTCIARFGVGKTTIDDIAREAGCSRATLYRYFGGKSDLIAAAVRSEAERITSAAGAAADAAPTLEDAVVAILGTAGTLVAEHDALRFVVTNEWERLLPHLTFSGGDRFLAAAGTAIAPSLRRFLDAEHAARAGEWIARVGMSLWFAPTAPCSLTDPASLRAYVRAFVLPAVAHSPSNPVPDPTPRG